MKQSGSWPGLTVKQSGSHIIGRLFCSVDSMAALYTCFLNSKDTDSRRTRERLTTSPLAHDTIWFIMQARAELTRNSNHHTQLVGRNRLLEEEITKIPVLESQLAEMQNLAKVPPATPKSLFLFVVVSPCLFIIYIYTCKNTF